MHVHPFVCWGIIQTQIYSTFLGTELRFKCSRGFIKQPGRNAVGCYIRLKIQDQSHLSQTGSCGIEMGEVMLVCRKWWDFCCVISQAALCDVIQLFQQQIQFFQMYLYVYEMTWAWRVLIYCCFGLSFCKNVFTCLVVLQLWRVCRIQRAEWFIDWC